MTFNSKYTTYIAIGVVVLILAGVGYFFYQKSQTQNPENAAQGNQEEARKVIAEVGKLIELPVGEEPTVATVSDVSKLKDQPFFQKAKNGDRVLIYPKAGKAILYDPILKKVLEVAPINIGTSSAQIASPTPTAAPTLAPAPANP